MRQNTTQMEYVLSPSTVLRYMFRLLGAIIRQNTINLFAMSCNLSSYQIGHTTRKIEDPVKIKVKTR
jgi:hypothetical protein